MNLNFSNINRQKILKNLNYQNNEIPEDINVLIDNSIKDLRIYSRVKYKYIELNKDYPSLENILIGKDINNLLESSHSVLLIGATLGIDIDILIRRYSYSDIVRSLILDATASVGVEFIMNEINNYLIEKYSSFYLTDRFSPGYGDMPINVQEKFLNLLNSNRYLGISTTSSKIMIPRKSITALIGISNIKQITQNKTCESCRLYLECEFLKENKTCG